MYSNIPEGPLGHGTGRMFKPKENLHRGCMWWRPDLCTEQDMNDIAASTLMIFEETLRQLSYKAFSDTDSHHLALAGGGALNKQGVDKIRHNWESVHVPKNPKAIPWFMYRCCTSTH